MGRVHGDFIYYLEFYFVLLMKSHLQSYPCPLQINFFWNLGFLLAVAIILQIVTGIFLALHYTSDLSSAYFSIFFLIREVYYGWCLRYLHSSGASFVFYFNFFILEELYFMVHTFIIQILGFQELFFSFPSLIECVSGGYCVHNPTLKRFFIFHFLL